jgi:hypothetical protein
MKNSFVSSLLTLSFIFSPLLYSSVANAQSTSSTGQGLTTCQFVEFLINIGAIASDKTQIARQLFNCQSGVSSTISANDYSLFTTAGLELVNIRANGSDGPVNVLSGQAVKITWTAKSVTKCYFDNERKNKKGSIVVYPTQSSSYMIRCVDKKNNSIVDTVSVNVVSSSNVDSQPSVDLKVNGYDSGISVDSGSVVLVSWTSKNVDECFSENSNRQTSGFYSLNVPEVYSSGSLYDVLISCSGTNGTSTDSIFISINPRINSQIAGTNSLSTTTVAGNGGLPVASSSQAYVDMGLATSTITGGNTATSSPTDTEATDLDHVQILSEGLNCVSAASNFLYQTYSYGKDKPVKYIWDKQKSQLIDNMAGAGVGNLMGHEGDREDASFSPSYANLERGMFLNLVIGGEAKCKLYGDGKLILRAYITAQGKDWVKEQEEKQGTGSGGGSSF